jgi:hypothetical protein
VRVRAREQSAYGYRLVDLSLTNYSHSTTEYECGSEALEVFGEYSTIAEAGVQDPGGAF